MRSIAHLSLFWGIHVGALVGIVRFPSWTLVLASMLVYALQMFAVTAGYHRYFAHRAYKTSRPFQFLLAIAGSLATQKGVIWWSSVHRHHHRVSDQPSDPHSPKQHGFWYSHVGWILSKHHETTDPRRVSDLLRYPELVWIDKYFILVPLAFAAVLYAAGGWPWLLFGYCIPTVAAWHVTFFVNSLAHVWGSQRYATGDTSRNNLFIALLTFGEGWHNNHHYYQSSANQGFFWWEIDITYYVLRVLSKLHIVWDLRVPPPHALAQTGSEEPVEAAPAPPQWKPAG